MYQFFKQDEPLADTSKALILRTMLSSSVDTLTLRVYDNLGSFFSESTSISVLDVGGENIALIAEELNAGIDVAEDLRTITVEAQQIGD